MTNTEKLIFLLFVIPTSVVFVTMDSEVDVEFQEQESYCEMVSIWNNDPRPEIDRAGWPDYKGTYQKYCK
jgi:hypothetical protein